MAHATYNDLREFFEVHPHGGDDHHHVVYVGGPQVTMICVTCGFSTTLDAVDAGLAVTHEGEDEA